MVYKAEYIWIDGTEPTARLRAKTKILALLSAVGDIDTSWLDPPEWQADGACREHPDLDFLPTRGEATAPTKAVFATCLVRDECLDYALSTGEKFGIWGGTSERERRAIRKQRMGEAA